MKIQEREFRSYKLYLKTYQRTGSKDNIIIGDLRFYDQVYCFDKRFYLFNLDLFYILISYIQCDIYYNF